MVSDAVMILVAVDATDGVNLYESRSATISRKERGAIMRLRRGGLRHGVSKLQEDLRSA